MAGRARLRKYRDDTDVKVRNWFAVFDDQRERVIIEAKISKRLSSIERCGKAQLRPLVDDSEKDAALKFQLDVAAAMKQ